MGGPCNTSQQIQTQALSVWGGVASAVVTGKSVGYSTMRNTVNFFSYTGKGVITIPFKTANVS